MKAAVVVAVVCSVQALAHADRPVAYIDEVAVFGGPDPDAARILLADALRDAGRQPRFADEDATPCGDDPSCLANRARAHGADVALRVTIADVGGEITASVVVVDADDARQQRFVEQSSELAVLDACLSAAFARQADEPRRASRATAWFAVGGAVVLGVAGGLATWKAHDVRNEFFEQHIDDNGDVFGISPADARREETRAQRWSAAGALLLGAAGAAGVTATVLFVRDDNGAERPSGVSVVGRF